MREREQKTSNEDCTSDWQMTRVLAAVDVIVVVGIVVAVDVVSVFYDHNEVEVICLLCNPTNSYRWLFFFHHQL